MTFLRWIPILCTVPLLAQASDYFPEEQPRWWEPQWELRLQMDRVSQTVSDESDFDLRRTGSQLRLRWEGNWDYVQYQLGTRSAASSDGNRLNIQRWDQQPSNGTQLDMAHVDFTVRSEAAFAELRMGFQDNNLVSAETLWDRDLRFLGAGLRVGLRDQNGLVQEAGVRLAAGRVRTLQGGSVDLAAGQAVLKLDTGPVSWTAHAGRWELRWQYGYARIRPVPGHENEDSQRLILDAYGLSVLWNTTIPVEIKSSGQRNPDTREDGSEFQISLGGLERTFWPRISYTWQRFDRTGTLYPVNGDQWWYYWNARGPRYEFSLPLPHKWLLSVAYLRHWAYGAEYPAVRGMITVTKRF